MSRPQRPQQKPDMRRFEQALIRHSVDVLPLYAALGIDPDIAESDNASISLVKHVALLELAARQISNRFLGIEMGLDSRSSSLGMLSYMLSNAATLEQALALLRRYVMLVSPGATITLLREDTQCILTYKVGTLPPATCCQAVEMTLAQFVLLIRKILDDDGWQPARVYLEHPAPATKDHSNFPLGGDMICGHFFSGVGFSASLLEQPIIGGDPQLLALLESQVQKTTETSLGSGSFLDDLHLLISSSLGDPNVTANGVARRLGMSRRTMYRRLRENGTSYGTVRENILLSVAKKNLSSTTISITELALELGYSDASAFNRAFKRLSGQTPLSYRKRQHRM